MLMPQLHHRHWTKWGPTFYFWRIWWMFVNSWFYSNGDLRLREVKMVSSYSLDVPSINIWPRSRTPSQLGPYSTWSSIEKWTVLYKNKKKSYFETDTILNSFSKRLIKYLLKFEYKFWMAQCIDELCLERLGERERE